MTKKITFSGFGGQGVLTLGQLACTMAMNKGFNVTWMPSYGAEMRGGTANCSVVISDEAIGAPVFSRPDILVAFNTPSIIKFAGKVADDGIIIINSSMAEYDDKDDKRTIYKVDAVDLANALGNAKVQNMIMLGVLLKALPMFNIDDAAALIEEKFGKKYPKTVPLNIEAVKKGMEA
jgi:2-oxoglutarate ferredoxin oxidoreductase subunit gamma